MPTFPTPEAIAVSLELGVGNVRITAGDRSDTVVEVRPSDDADDSDVQAAAQARVDYANGLLRVTAPKQRAFDFSKKSRSVEVSIDLPSGSRLSADTQMGDVRGAGRLGECRIKTSMGSVWLQSTGPLRLHTGFGDVTADEIGGSAEVSTGSGAIRLGEVDGGVAAKNSNGDTSIDAATGDVRVRAANGAIFVGRAGAGVDAKTSHGTIRLGEVARGSVAIATAAGDLEIGIAEGTAAWLELSTGFGQVRNLLEHATGPDEADRTVEVRGRTSYGDVTVRRS